MTVSRALAWLVSLFNGLIPDERYLQIRYRLLMGRSADLDNPQSFTEKLQWLKLHDRKPMYTTMVDKVACKDYVAGIIGSEYVIPTLGVWNSVEDIDFDGLPDEFVLKTSNGGGNNGVVICRDKAALNRAEAVKKLRANMNTDIYAKSGEWPYKNVPPRILAEKLLVAPDGESEIKDYKFFCFNGEVKFLKVDFNRVRGHRANYYDTDWNLLPFGEEICPPDSAHKELCPTGFQTMLEIAERLSGKLAFARIDLYNINGKIYFGEITFYPNAGFGAFISTDNQDWDLKLGQMLTLPEAPAISRGG